MAVHRYKAGESAEEKTAKTVAAKTVKKPAKATKPTAASSKKSKKQRQSGKFFAPLRRIGVYFVGSWRELRQVRWPNRKQTWAMTLAVILFSLLLGLVIFLLDAGFTLLFKKFIFS